MLEQSNRMSGDNKKLSEMGIPFKFKVIKILFRKLLKSKQSKKAYLKTLGFLLKIGHNKNI